MKSTNSFATAARGLIFSGNPVENHGNDDAGAIDDSGDADEDSVRANRNIAQLRIQKRNSEARLLHKVIPFHWAPMLCPLTETDLEACMALEAAGLRDDPVQQSTKQQMEYRIRKSDGLCYGLFNTYRPDDAPNWSISTLKHTRQVESGRKDRAKHVMFAHIVATLGKHNIVTDDDMTYPENWNDPVASKGSLLGHQTAGRTICLHSFVVSPEVRGLGIGKTAMKAYLQLMNESGMADRIALICKPVRHIQILNMDQTVSTNNLLVFNALL